MSRRTKICGIVGFINFSKSQSLQAEKTFKELLMVDQVRGSDATGIVWMNKDNKIDWLKTNENASDYLKRPDVYKFFGGLKSDGVVLGHNRAKTFGANTSVNAHPFDVGTIIGVHNGTVRNKYALCTNGHKFDVDSEALLTGIQEHGVDKIVLKAEGAFSVVYLNKELNTVNFFRNEERPMHFLKATEKGATPALDKEFMFYGSELMMLMWIVGRNGFKVGEHFTTVPFDHYTFDLDDPKPRVRTLEKPAPVVYAPTIYGGSAFDEEGSYQYGSRYARKHNAYVAPHVGKPLTVVGSSSTVPNDDLNEILPFELEDSPFLKNIVIDAQTKRHFIKVWRTTQKSDLVNFKITDMTPIVANSQWQIFGVLAGRKKLGLPIVVSAIVPNSIIQSCDKDTILTGNISLKRILDGGKSYEFIVNDVSILLTPKVFEEASCE